MARALRIHLPGQVWHLTHRCHHRRFLLQFARDRRLWGAWLYEARRRFGLSVLNYTATSNRLAIGGSDQRNSPTGMGIRPKWGAEKGACGLFSPSR